MRIPHRFREPASRLAILLTCVPLMTCAQPPSIEERFGRLRQQWLAESAAIAFSSRSSDYTQLPAFRSIVALGSEAEPVIARHLAASRCQEDFFLAHAIAEMRGWNPATVAPNAESEQAFCAIVLRLRDGSPSG